MGLGGPPCLILSLPDSCRDKSCLVALEGEGRIREAGGITYWPLHLLVPRFVLWRLLRCPREVANAEALQELFDRGVLSLLLGGGLLFMFLLCLQGR